MTTETHTLTVSGVRVSVVRKEIKNLHLGVYPPDGRVRVAVPLTVSDAAVRVAVIGKLRWIHRRQAAFVAQELQSRREMVSGESHYFLGRRYRLSVVMAQGRSGVVVRNRSFLELRVSPGLSAEQRERVLQRWYRESLCLEYLVVHELLHLLVRHHDDRFRALMDRHLPRWRSIQKTLNAAPLAHETWEY